MWKVRAIRGATTASENTVDSITLVVTELLDTLEHHNQLESDDIISVIFTVTKDLDALYPASIARERLNWSNIPLLDVQQMYVECSLDHCIRVLLYVNTPKNQNQIHHTYLRGARVLRPDLDLDLSQMELQRG
ncbi:MAG: chorismate mutase [Cyanobacteriota bacterium ELA615]